PFGVSQPVEVPAVSVLGTQARKHSPSPPTRIPPDAPDSGGVPLGSTYTVLLVLRRGNRPQMIGVHARSVVARVVDHQTGRNFPVSQLVRVPVGVNLHTRAWVEL